VCAAQQAVAALGDESYAGTTSFFRFREVASELTSFPYIYPAHQGRAAERILFTALLRPGQISLSNTHFDTTRANVELLGCQACDLPCPQAGDLDSHEPFKGDIDLVALKDALTVPDADRIGFEVLTGIAKYPENVPGYRIVRSKPILRHFCRTCRARLCRGHSFGRISSSTMLCRRSSERWQTTR
jgi:tryptophanase